MSVSSGQEFCHLHDPAREAERKRYAAKGGKGKASRRIATLWDEVRAVIDGVERRRLTPGQGNTMIRGYNTLMELAKLEIDQSELEISQRRLELDVEERTEVRQRLEELEEALSAKNGRGSTWGA